MEKEIQCPVCQSNALCYITHSPDSQHFLGKPVIQLCKQGTQLHFDIAQKNTIMWASEDDIPEQLQNRIIATIE